MVFFFLYYFTDVVVSGFCTGIFLYVCVQILVVLSACAQSSLRLVFILIVGLVFVAVVAESCLSVLIIIIIICVQACCCCCCCCSCCSCCVVVALLICVLTCLVVFCCVLPPPRAFNFLFECWVIYPFPLPFDDWLICSAADKARTPKRERSTCQFILCSNPYLLAPTLALTPFLNHTCTCSHPHLHCTRTRTRTHTWTHNHTRSHVTTVQERFIFVMGEYFNVHVRDGMLFIIDWISVKLFDFN